MLRQAPGAISIVSPTCPMSVTSSRDGAGICRTHDREGASMSNAVPVIDLSQYFAGGQQGKAAVAAAIAEACERIGFFKIAGHGVAQAMIDEAFAAAGAFFAQPVSVKDR